MRQEPAPSDLEKLYQQQILDHHRAPRNAGRLSEPTHQAEAHNPLCGDRVHVTLRLGPLPGLEPPQPGVLEARCDAQGCSLCRASGSLLTELVSGQPLSEVSAWLGRFLELAAAREGSAGPGDARLLAVAAPLLEVRKFPSRLRCVTLSWETLRTALSG